MKILEIIRSALSAPDASSADLRAALAAIDLPALEAAVSTAERHRTGLLLDGTERDLDDADKVLKTATRERDRAVAAKAELSKRLAVAGEAEAAAALDAERADVDREAKTVEKLLRDRWVKLQAEAVAILDRLHDAERAVFEVNNRLGAAGRKDTIAPVERRVFPAPDFEWPEMHSIINRTVLKPIDGAPGWRDETPGFSMNFGKSAGDGDRYVGWEKVPPVSSPIVVGGLA